MVQEYGVVFASFQPLDRLSDITSQIVFPRNELLLEPMTAILVVLENQYSP
jgi:hypothetical protein